MFRCAPWLGVRPGQLLGRAALERGEIPQGKAKQLQLWGVAYNGADSNPKYLPVPYRINWFIR